MSQKIRKNSLGLLHLKYTGQMNRLRQKAQQKKDHAIITVKTKGDVEEILTKEVDTITIDPHSSINMQVLHRKEVKDIKLLDFKTHIAIYNKG